MSISVSFDGSGMRSFSICFVTKPTPYFHLADFAGLLSTVKKRLNRKGFSSASFSSSPLSSMSSTLLLPKTRECVVPSSFFKAA